MKNFLRVNNGKVYKYSSVNDFYWSLDEYGNNEMGASKYSPQQVLTLLREGAGELLEKVEFKPKIVWPRVFFSHDCHGVWIMKSEKEGVVLDVKNNTVGRAELGIDTMTRACKELTGEARNLFLNAAKR